VNSTQRRTLRAIFERPTRADVAWQDVEALLLAAGAVVTEGRGSRVSVLLNGRVAVFHRPHPRRETKKGALRAVREFLRSAGVEP
jgi:HicA toxin of bacterial toxin-antitoxin,